MARIVGVFESNHAADDVAEQLRYNSITQINRVAPDAAQSDDLTQRFQGLGVPTEQIAEYHKRLGDGRWLLFVVAGALEVPTVQRAMRKGQALDIDLLPDTPDV